MQKEPTTTTTAAPVTALALTESDEDLGGGISVHRGVGGVEVVSRGRNVGLAVFLSVFCLAWDAIVVVVLLGGALPIWGVGYVLAGLFLTAGAADSVFNHTRISLGHGHLLSRRRPLPWPGGVDVPLHDVERVFVADGKIKQDGTPTSALWIAVRGGQPRLVLEVLPDAAHGERLARVLTDLIVTARG